MDDARTLERQQDRHAAAQRWVQLWTFRYRLRRAGRGMRAMGIAALASQRGFTALAVEATAAAEVERLWTDG